MAKTLSIFVLGLVALAAYFGTSSEAQTTHFVGDDLGWTIPPSGAIAYTAWASNKSFAVGDILVFNFLTGTHDVAAVTKASFDGCSGDSPISMSNTGPTNITLRTAGENFFICTIGSHCNNGQKLAINVTGTTVPTPPSPPSTPPPPPSSSETYIVGGALGWDLLPTGAYQNWTVGKTFMVGDTLVFNFKNGTHDVAEVTKSAFDSCNTGNATCLVTAGPANFTLTAVGEHYYTCTFPNHCSAGQKLFINVTEAVATPPSPSPDSSMPPSTSTNPSTTSPPGTTAPPPPRSSAPWLAPAAFPITFLCIFVALLH